MWQFRLTTNKQDKKKNVKNVQEVTSYFVRTLEYRIK